MSDILTAARGHFERLRRQTVEVPEWGEDGAPAVLYFDPPTLRQRHIVKHRANGNEARLLALAVILWAKDADGKPAFTDDAITLGAFETELDPAVIARVAGCLLGVSSADSLGN
jgi:hypothetical protein